MDEYANDGGIIIQTRISLDLMPTYVCMYAERQHMDISVAFE